MKKRKDGRYQKNIYIGRDESTNPYAAHHEKRLKRLPPN